MLEGRWQSRSREFSSRENICNDVWCWMLSGLIVVLVLQHIQIPNHDVVHLKLMQCYINLSTYIKA